MAGPADEESHDDQNQCDSSQSGCKTQVCRANWLPPPDGVGRVEVVVVLACDVR